jgi:phage-related protein
MTLVPLFSSVKDWSWVDTQQYVVKCGDAIYVLHCFQKKTQKTSKMDLDLAESRYNDLIKELGK